MVMLRTRGYAIGGHVHHEVTYDIFSHFLQRSLCLSACLAVCLSVVIMSAKLVSCGLALCSLLNIIAAQVSTTNINGYYVVKENHHYANKTTAMWGQNNETYFSVKVSLSGILICDIAVP